MASRFRGALLGSSTTQMRGYCQKVTSTSEKSSLNSAIAFGAGGVTSFIGLYLVFGTKLKELQAEERERQWRWDTR